MLVKRADIGNGCSFGVAITPLKGTEFEGDWGVETDLFLVTLLNPHWQIMHV
ncbi:MAG: hypothetical protein ACR65R_00420 [Methylomicrobium sp.]